MGFIKTLISLLPLLGLLGTVTGMVSVFEAMTYSGGNARSMAAGVSMATIPTMSGMVATLSGVLANTFLASKVASEESYMEDLVCQVVNTDTQNKHIGTTTEDIAKEHTVTQKHKKRKFVFLYKIAKKGKWKYLHFVS